MTLLLALALALLTSQAPQAALSGTWVAELKGITFMRLELRIADGRLIGAMSVGSYIHFDQSGNVDEAKPIAGTLIPISDVVTNAALVSFTRLEGNDPDQFRMRLIGKDTAELSFVFSEEDLQELKDEGIPVPKPVSMRRLP